MKRLYLFALFLFLSLSATPVFSNETIELQLKWKHTFQFAGYYVAKEKGYYDDEGLNVNIIEKDREKSPLKHILRGSGFYAVSDTGALLDKAKGAPIKVVATIFQHSPLALAVRKGSGIRSFSDLHGKRVMLQSDNMDAVILAAIYKAGLSKKDFIRQENSYNLNDLITGKTDAFSVYMTDQPHTLESLGIEYGILNPLESEIDFYGDILICNDQEIIDHPERTLKFINASKKGWIYALTHVEETILMIHEKYNPQGLGFNHLRFQAREIDKAILKDVVDIGYVSKQRWSSIQKVYMELGLIQQPVDIDDFIYKRPSELHNLLIKYRLELIIIGLLILVLLSACYSLMLKNMVKSRAADLLESEWLFRDIFENKKSIELIISPQNGKILDANRAAEAFYGYSKKKLKSLNISDINTLSEKEREAAITEGFHDNRSHFIFKHRLANGEVKDVEIHLGPVKWKGGEYLYAIVHDISERIQAEHYIDTTSDILEQLAKDEPSGAIYNAICSMHEKLYPDMRTSILLLKNNRLFHCSSPSLPQAYSQAIDGGEIGPSAGSCGTAAFLSKRVVVTDIANDPLWENFKDLALSHNLKACWSEPVLGSHGQVLGTFAMYFDHVSQPNATQIINIQSASRLVAIVREKEEKNVSIRKFSEAIEQSGESILITDNQGSIEYVNPSFTKITGYSSEEALGKNPRIRQSGQQSTEFYASMWNTISEGGVFHASIRDKRKSGEEYPALMTVSPIKDLSGDISHYVGIQIDMSEHEILEEKFRQSQKMEALGTLVGGIAHNFNNTLAGITGNLYLAKIKIADMPDVLSKLEKVEKLAFDAAAMIQQLLTFSRKDRINIKPFGLTSFLKEVSALNRSIIPENILFFEYYPSDELMVNGDETQLQQAVINLITNALDAVSAVANPEISLTLSAFIADDSFCAAHSTIKSQAYACIAIKDNGYGMSEKDKRHIFEPFFTTKAVGSGTGLGLSMLFGAIKNHQGVVEVESELGQGALFKIYLPILKESLPIVMNDGDIPIVQGSGQCILVVDDNTDVRNMARDVLESINYTVIEASDGFGAVDAYMRHRDIALILMDIVMPRLGGLEAAKQILAANAEAKIVFSSGYDKDTTYRGKIPDSRHMMLPKPYDINKLSKVIKQALTS
ncbi:MAG: ABC transporter substrate-binding protein [Mariprofundaceae bacterium]|nr:ABC transporter substrate-binding protein [Mariprofundaceae bacterium]